MRKISLLALITAAMVVACSGDEDPPVNGGEGGSGGSGGSGGDGGSGGSGGTGGDGCPGVVDPNDGSDVGWEPDIPATFHSSISPVEREEACGSAYGWISALRGWVAAPGGVRLAGSKAQVCLGDSICLPPVDVNEEGVFTVVFPSDRRCIERAALQAWQPDSGRATYYRALDLPTESSVLLLEDPVVLPWATPANVLPPRDPPDEPRSVVFDDGLVLEVTPSLYRSMESVCAYEVFGGRRIPNDAVGLVSDSTTFDGLYAFFPEAELSKPGFKVIIPNVTDLPAKSTVGLFVLGGLACSELHDGTTIHEGTWEEYGEGTVSDDGETISSEVGMPCFGWLAYKLKE